MTPDILQIMVGGVVSLGSVMFAIMRWVMGYVEKRIGEKDEEFRQKEAEWAAADKTRMTQINGLSQQISELSGYKALYHQLKEGHDRLEEAHNQLKKQFSALQEAHETEKEGRVKLQQENERLNKRCGEFERENDTLKIENRTYKSALIMVGERLAEHDSASKSEQENGDQESPEKPQEA